jgi:holo-[acyl-carrier protein] synthase
MQRVGVDIIEIGRIRATVERWGVRFLNRIYTPTELAYARGRAPQLAARFASKEAVMKLLGTGIRGVAWREIEVVRQRSGAPAVALHGRALQRARRLGLGEVSLSISHSREYAVAFAVGQADR